MRVEIVRQADDLHRETWTIQLSADHINPIALNLIEHSAEFLPSRRHRKWERTSYWYRYQSQDKSYGHPIPDDVAQEAKDTFKAAIQAAKVEVG